MPIDSVCGGCGKTLRVDDQFAGKKARCPQCGSIYDVPLIQPTPLSGSPERLGGSASVFSSAPQSNNPFTEPAPPAPTLTPFENSSQGGGAANIGPMSNPVVSATPVQTTALFLVKTPDGVEYGPVDSTTIEQWSQQGRLNEACFVRSENSPQWVGLAAWRFQQRQHAAVNPFATLPNPGGGIPGIPSSANQNYSYRASPNGVVVLILGIGSWVLCPTIIGSPVCSLISTILGIGEFRRVREGVVDSSQLVITHVGFWLGILNLICCVGLVLLLVLGIALGP